MSERTNLDPAVPRSLLAGYANRGSRSFDELLGQDGRVRPHWEYVLHALEALAPDELARRRNEMRQLLHENGVTYNVYTDAQRSERLWPLDPIPVLFSSEEWHVIEHGLVQRAELLEQILADLYGPRRLIERDLIPAAVVYGHPGFVRPCVDVPAPGGRHLPLYAADLVRAPDGHFLVIGDRSQAPSGAGYALENRAVVSRVLPSIFRDAHAHRLPMFFRRMRAMVHRLAPTKEAPHVALLTPGPGSETYFEHAYLATNLGCTLAHGDDLVVNDQRLWLRTLDGLRPVDVLLRRVDDTYCDPLELRADSVLGAAGLLQAVRARTLAVLNPLGSGILENPALMPFLPRIAKELLGEDLELPSVATWWCGNAAERRFVLDELDRLVVKPIFPHAAAATKFGPLMDSAARDRLRDALRARPYLYVAQEYVPLSTTPVLNDRQLEPRPMLLRAFLVAEENGYEVMPGGLCRVAPAPDRLLVSNQEGGVSKDVWVLASEPEREVRLASADRPLLSHEVGEGLPGRAADNLFWVGRYAVRAETGARFIRNVARRIDTDGIDDPQITILLSVLSAVLGLSPASAAADEPATTPERMLLAAVQDARRTSSVRFNLAGMARAARAVRDRLSVDTLRIINGLDRELAEPFGFAELRATLERVLTLLAAFTGLTNETMGRSIAWRALQIGRAIERALGTAALLRSFCPPSMTPSAGAWYALIAIAIDNLPTDALARAATQPAHLLGGLIDAEDNPYAVLYQLRQLERFIDSNTTWSTEARLVHDAIDELSRGTGSAANRQLDQDLDQLLAAIQERLMRLSDDLGRRYFRQGERPQQLVRVV